MKKNVMMRLACFLLVAVLISTSAISGTYAKYVTKADAGDAARVAKWGIKFETTSDLFAEKYKYDDDDYKASYSNSVVSTGGNLVAPGTSGDAYSFTTTGTPEVSYVVTFDVTEFETVHLGGNSEICFDRYHPITYTVTFGEKTIVLSNELPDWNGYKLTYDLEIEKLAYFFNVTDQRYYYTTDYTAQNVVWEKYGATAPELTIAWEWPFENTYSFTYSDANQNIAIDADMCDTLLGDLAAGYKHMTEDLFYINDTYRDMNNWTDGGAYNLDVKWSITATATQID